MTNERGSSSDHYELARLLADFHQADRSRDAAIQALTKHAHAMDPTSATAGSTIAWAERRVKRFYDLMGSNLDTTGAMVVAGLFDGVRG